MTEYTGVERDMIAMCISSALFDKFGFGPSLNTCLPFVDQVIAEADAFGRKLERR